MIEKSIIQTLVDQWLEGKDYFLTDLVVSNDDRIVVEIDHQDGVWIEDCVSLSKHIENALDREEADFELEVGSAGLGQPFKVLRQYEIHLGEAVEVLLRKGVKLRGILADVSKEGLTLTTQEKVKEEGAKRPKIMAVDHNFSFEEIKETRLFIDFK